MPAPLAVAAGGLVKRYGGTAALDGLDLEVPAGSIFGFLGPNGAGKTTALRSLLGLVRLDAGRMQVLGTEVPDGLPALRGRIGAVVEAPAPYPPLSGRANLRVMADLAGGRGRDDVDGLLELMGLADTGRKPVSQYSLGMRQRLAVAGALLGSPDLLVLDEPANGLDPAGQQALRQVLHGVRDRGATLVISSHQLADVQALCDHVGIIDKGRLVWSGPIGDLLVRPRAWRVDLGGADPGHPAALLSCAGVRVLGANPFTVECGDPSAVTRILGEAGVWLSGLEPVRAGLEDVFLQLTGTDGSAAGSRG